LIVTGVLGLALWQARPYLGESRGLRIGIGVVAYLVGYGVIGRLAGVLSSSDLWFLAGYLGWKRKPVT
jgi:hypothetical protein